MSRPRIGFLGTGWIGRDRMAALIGSGTIEAVAICDPSEECAAEAAKLAPGAEVVPDLDMLLACGLDGIVIATPSALHAGQAIAALEQGIAVFCQKPLGRNAAEVRLVVEAARNADRLLRVDLSDRFTQAALAIRAALDGGELGRVFAADMTFHNAYGPDKPWFYDRALSGGGCVMDLGVHLVDLALWLLGFPEVDEVDARLYAKGELLAPGTREIEDYAVARLTLAGGALVRLACSWNLHAGQQAVIQAEFYGGAGGAGLRNVNGSFYDFEAFRYRGTDRVRLSKGPDEWGGGAAIDWARRLAAAPSFDPAADRLVDVAQVIDRIYAGASTAVT